MSVLMKSKQSGKNLLFIKGAPDYLLKKANKVLNLNGEPVAFNEN